MSSNDAPQASIPDLEAMFSDSNRFLNRFIWTLVLEPPKALQHSAGKTKHGDWPSPLGIQEPEGGGIK